MRRHNRGYARKVSDEVSLGQWAVIFRFGPEDFVEVAQLYIKMHVAHLVVDPCKEPLKQQHYPILNNQCLKSRINIRLNNFSKNAPLTPKDRDLVYDTSEEAGANTHGYLDEYKWMGLTVREQIFKLLNEVLADKSLRVDIFAYDLNEPDLINILLKLAKQGRIRIILDNAPLHATRKGQKAKSGKAKGPTWEDKFTAAFKKAAKNNAEILRAHSHDKVFVVSKGGKGKTVLTGSTNFSVTGMYVNSNHILVFDDLAVAQTYYKLGRRRDKEGFCRLAIR